MYKCDEKEEKKMEETKVLRFRKDCAPCRKHKPTQCPKLRRLQKLYDQNEMKYNHGKSVDKVEKNPDRMDVIKGYTIKPKKLPPLPKLDDCFECAKLKPTSAPKLVRPKQMYDPYQQKRTDSCVLVETCEKGPPRMDTVLGYTVKQKSLPKFPTAACVTCRKYKPLSAPKLVSPRKLYDPEKLTYNNYELKEKDEVKPPPRMDDVVGFEIKQKILPDMSKLNDCAPCRKHKPNYAPQLRSLKQRYDPSEMKYKHVECKTEAAVCACPRMDNVIGLKITRKVLPKIEFNDFKTCQPLKPSTAPPLRRLEKLYDYSGLKYNHEHCPELGITNKIPRMDEVTGFKIEPKKLPPIPTSNFKPCLNYIADKFPKLGRLKKLFDDSKMVYQHENCTMEQVDRPPDRMDDIVGYKVEKKDFPNLLLINNKCLPCQKSRPKTAPKLVKPVKLYNDTEMKYNHPCSKEVNEGCPDRMDDVLGFEIKSKTLPSIFGNVSCKPCQKHRPSEAPELGRPIQLYDPTLLERKDKIDCSKGVECSPRMDEVVGWAAKKRTLPSLLNNNCKPCRKNYPTKAPKLVRLKRKYDPNSMTHTCKKIVEDECELNPPRMDDVLCWKPKKKKLPSIFQKCGYSTLAFKHKFGRDKPIYNTYSKVQYTKRVIQNVQFQSKRYYSRRKPSCGPNKGRKSEQKKSCPKFKLGNCTDKIVTDAKGEKHKCKKVEAPYSSFNENFEGFHERELSECAPYHIEILQPKNLKSGIPFVLKPPPPRFSHIDPEKEIRCYEDKQCEKHAELLEDPYKEQKKKFKNPCGDACKLKRCKPRVRSHCDETNYFSNCKKVEAPYESFSDHCPQFPPIEPNECDVVDNFDISRHLYMNEELRKRNEKKTCRKTTFDYEQPNYKCDYTSGGPKQVPMKGPIKKGSKSGSKTALKTKSGKGSSCKMSTKGSKATNTKTTKTKTDLLETQHKPGKSSSRKASNAVIKTPKEKLYTPSKSTTKCDPRQSKHNNEFCCNINNEQSNRCCIPDKELMQICKKRHPQSIWEKMCAYFRARPNCPAPDEWKKKRLREKAEAAAKAAGLELCPPRKKSPCGELFYARTVKPKKPYQFPPEKRKRTYCSKNTSSAKALSKTSCAKSKYHSDCRRIKKRSNLKLTSKTTSFGKNPLGSKLTTNSQINKNTRQFSTYSNILTRTSKLKNIRKPILQNQPIFDTDTKPASYINNKPSKNKLYKCSSLTENYVGKIYKLKLTKIGVRNALITRKETDDAHTFCYICKIVQKDNSIFPNSNANIKNIKIRANPERRTTF